MSDLGFNRASLGVQSFSDSSLRLLGRIHTAEEARRAYRDMREASFQNLNLDLIFGLPGQSLGEWRKDLSEAIALAPEHLSLYNLTIEPETEFGRRRDHGLLQEVDEDLAAAMYEAAVDMAQAAGYEQYEISNFCRPGKECRHNLVYWHNNEYVGLGVGAASYSGGTRSTHTRDRAAYVAGVRSGRIPQSSEEKLEPRAALGEEIMLRLRLNEGVPIPVVNERYGVDLENIYAGRIDFLVSERLLSRHDRILQLTPRGRLLANEVCRRFL